MVPKMSLCGHFLSLKGLVQERSRCVTVSRHCIDYRVARPYLHTEPSPRTLLVRQGGYARGLQAVFARPSVTLDPAILERYVGKYELGPNINAEIIREDRHLVLVVPGGMKLNLVAESEKEFFVKGVYLHIKGRQGDNGKVLGLDIEPFQGGGFAKKME
jgi:hypothetical protein